MAVAMSVLIAGCASGPLRPPDRDGPPPDPPPDLVGVPDAEPKLEPIRSGGPNKPYEVFGRGYQPITQDAPFTERGLASWYGRKFHGRRTASGEVYNMYAMTAAHPTLPIPSYARIRNPANGREVLVRINDRGPFHPGRIVDLSYTAALKLDLLRNVAQVQLERITFDQIRTGAWRREGNAANAAVASVASVASIASVPPVTSVVNPPIDRAAIVVPSQLVMPVSTGASASGGVGTEPVAAAMVAPPIVEAAARPAITALEAAVADAPAARAYTSPARGFWVQLGAFRARDGAEVFQQRVAAEADWLSPLLAVFTDASMFRLQAGPYPSREEARGVAERVRDGLKLVPVIVERR